jgi:hypothetical protein
MKFHVPIVLLLIGLGCLFNDTQLPEWANPVTWFASGPVTVCIVEETADRSALPAGQRAILQSLTFIAEVEKDGGKFLGCVDKDVLGKDGKPPAELIPFLEEAKKVMKLPALVYQRGSRAKAIELPEYEPEALEALK